MERCSERKVKSAMNDERKMKILQVHNYYQIPGGEDTVVANEKKILEEYGHTVIQYSRNNSELIKFSKFRKLLLPVTTIFNPTTYRNIKKIIREQKIDAVHVHNTLNLISPAVYYAALACKTPVVQTIHNFRLLCPGATFYRDGHICEECVEHGLQCATKYRCYRGSKAQTLACVVSIWIHRMTGIYGKLNYICLTEFNKQKLLTQKQIQSEQVYIKPNFAVSEQNAVISYENRLNQFIFAGRLDKLKGIDVLLEAWMKLGADAPKLIVCGTGPMEEWCRKFILDNGLYNIEMKGFVENSKTKNLIANSKALIIPTQWYEGFPMTVAEAYSVGTPVIGSSMGNVGSVIVDGATGMRVDAKESEKLADALNLFISADKDMVQSTKDEYDAKYSENENYKLIISIYKAIIQRE